MFKNIHFSTEKEQKFKYVGLHLTYDENILTTLLVLKIAINSHII